MIGNNISKKGDQWSPFFVGVVFLTGELCSPLQWMWILICCPFLSYITPHPSPKATPFSLRLGHTVALTLPECYSLPQWHYVTHWRRLFKYALASYFLRLGEITTPTIAFSSGRRGTVYGGWGVKIKQHPQKRATSGRPFCICSLSLLRLRKNITLRSNISLTLLGEYHSA